MLTKHVSTGQRISRLGLHPEKLFLCLLTLAVFSTAVFGQSYQGSLRGSVRDNGGSVVSAATLTLINAATNEPLRARVELYKAERKDTADSLVGVLGALAGDGNSNEDDGAFRMTGLAPGSSKSAVTTKLSASSPE